MKKALLALAATTAAALPLAASAQLTANVTLTSNYKFRGQDQDLSRTKAFKPALQGGFDYTFGDTGFYIGNWNSTVDFTPVDAHLESDFYGGYKLNVGDFALDFGALAYIYPNFRPGRTVELYAAAGWGPLLAKYSHTVSDDYFNFAGATTSNQSGRNTGYFNLAYTQPIQNTAFSLKANIGYTRFASDIVAPNYTDYSVGAGYDLGSGASISATVVGANKRDYFGYVNKNRFVVALSKTM